MLPPVTYCVTNGLMPAETTLENGAMGALVKGRVPADFIKAIDADVVERRKNFPRASRADVLRDALKFYFIKHPPKPNGKAGRHQDNGR